MYSYQSIRQMDTPGIAPGPTAFQAGALLIELRVRKKRQLSMTAGWLISFASLLSATAPFGRNYTDSRVGLPITH